MSDKQTVTGYRHTVCGAITRRETDPSRVKKDLHCRICGDSNQLDEFVRIDNGEPLVPAKRADKASTE